MPIIKEEDLLKLHDKIKKLEGDKERMELLQEQQRKRYLKQVDRSRKSFVATLVALILFVALGVVLWIISPGGGEEKIKIVKEKVFVKEDKEKEKDLVYKIQICALKDVSVNFESTVKHYKNPTSGLNEYFLGSFDSYEKAKNFVEKLDLLGFKDAYIIALYKGDKIEVRDAINMQLDSGNNQTASEL